MVRDIGRGSSRTNDVHRLHVLRKTSHCSAQYNHVQRFYATRSQYLRNRVV